MLTGVAGILSVLVLTELTAVYGLGLIVWFVWLGIVMLGERSDALRLRVSHETFGRQSKGAR